MHLRASLHIGYNKRTRTSCSVLSVYIRLLVFRLEEAGQLVHTRRINLLERLDTPAGSGFTLGTRAHGRLVRPVGEVRRRHGRRQGSRGHVGQVRVERGEVVGLNQAGDDLQREELRKVVYR